MSSFMMGLSFTMGSVESCVPELVSWLPVELPEGGKRNNYIHLDMQNFNITEKGDLLDMLDFQELNGIEPTEEDDLGVPDL